MRKYAKIPSEWYVWRGFAQPCGDDAMRQAVGYVRAAVAQCRELNNPLLGLCREYENARPDGQLLFDSRLRKMTIGEYDRLKNDVEHLSQNVWDCESTQPAGLVGARLLGELAVRGYDHTLFCRHEVLDYRYGFGFEEYETLTFMDDETDRMLGQEPMASSEALRTIRRFDALVGDGTLNLASPLCAAEKRSAGAHACDFDPASARLLSKRLWRFRACMPAPEVLGNLLLQPDYGSSLMDLMERESLAALEDGGIQNVSD